MSRTSAADIEPKLTSVLNQPDSALDEGQIDQTYAHLNNHVILCSLDNLGYRILEQLLDANIPVIVIDDRPDPRFARRARRRKVPILQDDCRLSEVLEMAGLKRAQAIIAVNNDDLHNLETVLTANETCNGVRAVASFFNSEIGEELALAVPNARILSLSEIAPSAFVSAIIPSNVLRRFKIQDEELVVVEATPHKAGTVGAFYSQVTPLLLSKNVNSRAKKAQNIVCPPQDAAIEPDDRVGLIGIARQLKGLEGVTLNAADLEDESEFQAHGKHPAKKRRSHHSLMFTPGKIIQRFVSNMELSIRIVLLALAITLLISVVFFCLYYHDLHNNGANLSPLESLYFTITIISTIGFGDLSLYKQDWWVIIYGIVLELIGAGSLAVLYAFVTNFIVSRRIEQTLGIQRATDMENHVVVTSLGNSSGFGYRVVESLVKRGEAVVVIERDEQNRFAPLARALGVTIIFGDSRLQESLKLANIAKASSIAIVSNNDMVNLETALAVRSITRDIRLVVRLFDRTLAEKIERTFGIGITSDTSTLSAPSFIAAALNYEVISSFYIRQKVFIVVRLVVSQEGQIQGQNGDWLYQQAHVQVLAHIPIPERDKYVMEAEFVVHRVQPTFHPNPHHTIFKSGDTLIFAGPYDHIIQVHKLNTTNL